MRIAFLGNHTVGVRALGTLASAVDVVAVVAHPPDPEDGVRYESVFEFAKKHGLPAIRGKPGQTHVRELLQEASPELIWVTDYRYLLPIELIDQARLGAVNLHPSLLPRYRGRAPVNWAILHGESELGLTAHFIDEGMDSGDIILQAPFRLERNEDVGDALNKLLPIYEAVTREVIGFFEGDQIPRRKQDESKATCFPARRPDDGQIDWDRPAEEVLNLIRAVASPYPGAFSFLDNARVRFWKACPTRREAPAQSGDVIRIESRGPVIACGEGALVATRYDAADDKTIEIASGKRFRWMHLP